MITCRATGQHGDKKLRCQLPPQHRGHHEMIVDGRLPCTADNCIEPRHARGLCARHYQVAADNGTLPVNSPRSPFCTKDGCGKRTSARGLCTTHYAQAQKAGTLPDVIPTSRRGVVTAIVWDKTSGKKCGHTGCIYKATAPRGLCRQHYVTALETNTLPPPKRPGTKQIPFQSEEWEREITAFLKWFHRRKNPTERTVEIRTYHLKRFSNWVQKPPFQVTVHDISNWLADADWNNSTYRSCRSSVKVFYTWAKERDHCRRLNLDAIPQVPNPPINPKPVSEEDFQAAIRNSPPDVSMMIRLAGEIGLRRAEVAMVHIDNVIEETNGYHTLRVFGKGRKTRFVPLPEKLTVDLVAHIEKYGHNGWAFPTTNHDTKTNEVVPTDRGHLSPHWVGSLVSKHLPDGYTMHKLRHRAATQAHRRAGGDLLLTSTLLGHSSVSTTQIYVQPDNSRLRAIVEEIAT